MTTTSPSSKAEAAVVLLRSSTLSRVLALTRGDNFTDWHLPGGKLEEGETHCAAAVREVREEVGLSLREEDLIELCRYTSRSGSRVVAFRLGFSYSMPAMLKRPMARTEAGQPAWAPRDLLTLPTSSFADECRLVFLAADLQGYTIR